jgi:MGT family glycosyltransferase
MLGQEPVNLILTIGHDQDPDVLGEQPANVHIERYIPQSLLLPYCDLVITHGGSGTVKDALSLGLPLVILPMGADQPLNARRCAALGVARVIEPDRRTAEAIREAANDVLQDPRYRQRAEGLRDEMQALPGLEYAIALLERLATERAPLIARRQEFATQ